VFRRCIIRAETNPVDSIAPPTTLLWAYYYLALHLSHPLHPAPSFKRALDLLEVALKHTPTLPEVYMAKAMVLKRAGDAMGAAVAMEDARLLDGQDRFLNGKAAKYWLRAGDVQKAEELLGMFTKVRAVPVRGCFAKPGRSRLIRAERLESHGRSDRSSVSLVLAGRR
jgi:hypothetical protein